LVLSEWIALGKQAGHAMAILRHKDKAFDVANEIGHSDLGHRSGDPDSPSLLNLKFGT
jgi:hypothetical protein